jgi:hypothetical protein
MTYYNNRSKNSYDYAMNELNSIFHTEDGPLLVVTKEMGENQVPLGCFYDEGEALQAFELFLQNYLLPFVKTIPQRLQTDIGTAHPINYAFWVSNYGDTYKDLALFEKQIMQGLHRFPIHGFEAFINIEVLEEYGGFQLHILHDIHRYSNFDETEEYPVHAVSIGQFGKTYEDFVLEHQHENGKLENVYSIILAAFKLYDEDD